MLVYNSPADLLKAMIYSFQLKKHNTMLIEQKHYPCGGGFPWGTIMITVAIIGGVSYVGYQAFKMPKIVNLKTKENERE